MEPEHIPDHIYVGIDVAKARLDVAIRPSGDRREIPNGEAGIAELVKEMQQLNPAALVLEASGGLELPLVVALAAASLPVVVVNPRQARDFAKATGKLAKTDSLDAAVLAHFAEALRPTVRTLPDAETRLLNSLVARRQQVMAMLVAERNRLSSAVITVRPRIETHIAWLKQELDDLDQTLRRTLRQSPLWREKDDLLRSVPGVGDQTSATLLACLPELGALGGGWTAARSLPWWAWLPSTGTAAPCGANGPSGAAGPGCGHPFTWRRWWPAASTRSSGTFISGSWLPASPRSWL